MEGYYPEENKVASSEKVETAVADDAGIQSSDEESAAVVDHSNNEQS